jgi:hypothetical protein
MATTDPHFDKVTLLLSAAGPVGASVFTDSSKAGQSISVVGDAKVSDAKPFFGGKAIRLANGNSCLLIGLADSLGLWGGADFTLEAWFNFDAVASSTLFSSYESDKGIHTLRGPTFVESVFYTPGTYTSALSVAGSSYVAKWVHVAVVLSSGVLKIYVDGKGGGATTVGVTLDQAAKHLAIGGMKNGSTGSPCYVGQVRVTKVARYTADFTPPTEAFPVPAPEVVPDPHIDKVTLLTQFVKKQPEGYWELADALGTGWNLSNGVGFSEDERFRHAASLQFDGTGGAYELLTVGQVSPELHTGDFTLELAIKPTQNGRQQSLIADRSWYDNGIYLYIEADGRLGFQILRNPSVAQNTIRSPAALPLNQWTSIAITRQGSTLRMFIDGVLVTTSTDVLDGVASADYFRMGEDVADSARGFKGFMDCLRITQGLARYTANYTIDMAAFDTKGVPFVNRPADKATLLLNAGGGMVKDESINSFDLVKYGSILTTASNPKYLSESVRFDDESSYIEVAGSAGKFRLDRDFTIEAWLRPSMIQSRGTQFIWRSANGDSRVNFQLTRLGRYEWTVCFDGVDNDTNATYWGGYPYSLKMDEWVHVALVRSGNVVRLFANGKAAARTQLPANSQFMAAASDGVVKIGGDSALSGAMFHGSMQDLRFTPEAVYTSLFEPPTAALDKPFILNQRQFLWATGYREVVGELSGFTPQLLKAREVPDPAAISTRTVQYLNASIANVMRGAISARLNQTVKASAAPRLMTLIGYMPQRLSAKAALRTTLNTRTAQFVRAVAAQAVLPNSISALQATTLRVTAKRVVMGEVAISQVQRFSVMAFRQVRASVSLRSRFIAQLIGGRLKASPRALVFHPHTGGFTEYSDYGFEQLFSYNGQAYGTKQGQVFSLSSVGTAPVTVRTVKTAPGKLSNLQYCYVRGKGVDALRMDAVGDAGAMAAGQYAASQDKASVRGTFGRGMNSMYWQVELQSDAGARWVIDDIAPTLAGGGTRRIGR